MRAKSVVILRQPHVFLMDPTFRLVQPRYDDRFVFLDLILPLAVFHGPKWVQVVDKQDTVALICPHNVPEQRFVSSSLKLPGR